MKVDQTNLCQDDTGIEGRIVISKFLGSLFTKRLEIQSLLQKATKITTQQIGR